MSIFKKSLIAAAVVALVGCNVEINVPVGGALSSESGQYRVEAGQSSSIEVSDLVFHELFTAEPAAGYLFAGWEKGDRGLCGGSLEPCELYTSWMSGNDSLLAILESDETFFLNPTFLPDDQVRMYAVGDRVSFAGTLLTQQGAGAEVTRAVTAQMKIITPIYTLAGKNVMAAQLVVLNALGEEVLSRTTHFWQEAGGAFYDFTDEYGNQYLDAAANQPGLESIPAPLVPFSSGELQFYAMYGGHTSGPLTVGTRSIEVGEVQAVEVPMLSTPVYPVTLTDSWSYLVTFGEYRRDSVVERDQTLWVSQVKGIIKSSEIRRKYSSTGTLLETTTLELEAIRASF